MTEENIKYMNNNMNHNMNPRFLLNNVNSNFSTNESVETQENKCNLNDYLDCTPKSDMYRHNNWNYTEKRINFGNAQNFFNNNDNQTNLLNNLNFNPKSSSFLNPSDHYIKKQLLYCYNQDSISSINFQNNTSLNNIEQLFSPNVDKGSEKKKLKKDQIPSVYKYFIFLENVIK